MSHHGERLRSPVKQDIDAANDLTTTSKRTMLKAPRAEAQEARDIPANTPGKQGRSIKVPLEWFARLVDSLEMVSSRHVHANTEPLLNDIPEG